MARGERSPSFQFYPRDYLADGAVQAMSFDQQGRYWRSLCLSWDTDTPGLASEDQWRRWMAYSEKQWGRERATMVEAFTDCGEGSWRQERMVKERAKQVERYLRASSGATKTNAVRWGNGIA